MCIASIAWNAHPRWQLVVLANRDERHARPAAPLARWNDGRGIIAGRDLESGGSWLGIGEGRRFALVTNRRTGALPRASAPSRGALVSDWLAGEPHPDDARLAACNPFNLVLVGNGEARIVSNHPRVRNAALAPGIVGVSNGPAGEAWPKTRKLDDALAGWLAGEARDPVPLMATLRDETLPPGVKTPPVPPGPGREPRDTPIFIRDNVYGTRCSTVIMIAHDGNSTIHERRFDSRGEQTGETRVAFCWPAQSEVLIGGTKRLA